MQLRYYQKLAVEKSLERICATDEKPLVVLPTGCHAKDQGILMYDGSIKLVQDIQVGDKLMGPDSLPRNVLQLCRGRQEMRKISPVKGSPFVVNKDHILSLKRTNQRRNKNRIYRSTLPAIINESVGAYESSSKNHKHLHKLYRAEIKFHSNDIPLDPYILGCILGDGHIGQAITMTSMDDEIKSSFIDYMDSIGDEIGFCSSKGKAESFNIIGCNIRNRLKTLNLTNKTSYDKFIPELYKINSREIRLMVLAGLIDTDGHRTCGGYDFISKSEILSRDVAFISRSIGLAAYINKCYKKCQTGNGGYYYRVSISGDCSIIPVRVKRKICGDRKQIKDVLITGFSVDKLPEDDYYGFTLDGDNLYLLDDFTVTHNTGKSLVVAEICRFLLESTPETKILVATHSSEIVMQNYLELVEMWPFASAGIYSASLGRKQFKQKIIFANVQSIEKKAAILGTVNLLLIDEAHTIPKSESGQWHNLIKSLRAINPDLKIIGLTATPYRLDTGCLFRGDGALFTNICYEYSILKAIEEGFLSELINHEVDTHFDTSGVKKRKDEFIASELAKAVDIDEKTKACVNEIIIAGHNRRKWMVFAVDVKHADHINEYMVANGISSEVVSSKHEDRKGKIERFRNGQTKCLISIDALTTGFNVKDVDLIACLRPTESAGLWVQMLGRGTRLYDGKKNCLVLDFAGNTDRHGPIDRIRPKDKTLGSGNGEAPIKQCPDCRTFCYAGVRLCHSCGFEFPVSELQISAQPSRAALLSKQYSSVWYAVTEVFYEKFKNGLKIEYTCGKKKINRFIFPGSEANKWLSENASFASNLDDVLKRPQKIRRPARICCLPNGKYMKVISESHVIG